MTTNIDRRVRYWDDHTRDDEELTQSLFHQAAIEYLMLILKALFYGQKVGIASDVNFYHDKLSANRNEPVSPDIALVDNLEIEGRAPDAERSHWIGIDGPPPRVVFEISSPETWAIDLNQKPAKYALIKVKEYIAFDPHQPGFWTKAWRQKGRLIGWRLDNSGNYQEIAKNADGWLWSEELNSWLAVNDKFLRLYTPDKQLRVDLAEIERREKEAIRQWANIESRRANIERQRADEEGRRASSEQQKLEELREKIRKLGYDPDNL